MKKFIIIIAAAAILLPLSNYAQTKTSAPTKKKSNAVGAAVNKALGNTMPRQAFIIQSVKNFGKNPGGCWDIPGRPGGNDFKNGQNIQVWNLDQGPDRFYIFRNIPGTKYYNIHVGNSLEYVVDLQGNKTHNGANIHVWKKNNGDAQKFYVEHLGHGRYKIKHISGKVICLAGRDNKNGSNVHIWDDHTIPATQWVFLDATSKRHWVPGK